MKKLSTKIISIILSFSLIFALVPPSAFSASGNADLALNITTDKSEYMDGAEIIIGGTATNQSGSNFADEIDISLSATPAINLSTDTITIGALAAGETQQINVSATADRVRFSEGVFQAFYDIVTGHFYSALWKFFAAVSPKHECIEIRINNVPAVIMYKIDSSITFGEGGGNDSVPDVENTPLCAVTFVMNDGSSGAYKHQLINPNTTVAEPEAPAREGYEFTGWYTEPETITLFDFSTEINSNVILYAGWGSPNGDGGNYSASSGGGTVFSITAIEIEDDNAEITVNVNEMSGLVVEFSNEDTEEIFHTVSAQTPDYCELTEIVIPVNYTLPEYFIVTARLFDANGDERCNPYVSLKYTSAYELFKNKTILDFDGQTVVNFDESIDNNFGVLSEDVIEIMQSDDVNVLTAQTVTSYASDAEESIIYTFESYDYQVANLDEGDIVFAADVNGIDRLFKIGYIEFDDGTCTIIPSDDNDLTDFYDFLKVDMHVANQNLETRTYGARAASVDIIDVNTSPSFNITPFNLTWTPKEWLSINGTLSGSVGLNISLEYDVVVFGRDYFAASVTSVTEFNASITVTAEAGDDPEDQLRETFEKEYNLPKAVIPTPVTGLAIEIEVGVPVVLSAEGSGTISYSSTTTSGFVYTSESGRQDIDEKQRTFDIKAEGKLEFSFGPMISLELSFLSTVVEAELEAQAGFRVTVTGDLSIVHLTDAPERHACTACLSAEAKWFVTASVKLEYEIIDDILEGEVFNVEILDVEGIVPFGEFTSCYFSLIHSADSVFGTAAPKFGFGECPNMQYRTTFVVKDAEGNELSGNNISVRKNNGNYTSSGAAKFVDYLYDGTYSVSTVINNNSVNKTVVVSGSSQTVELKENSGDGKISGKVCSAEDGRPVSGATIIISKDSLIIASLSSNSGGNYSITLPEGVYCVEITKDGYMPFDQYVNVNEASETYLETALLISESEGQGGFSGIITDAVTGEPVSGVEITIRRGWDNPDSGSIVAVLETNSNGEFKKDIITILGIVFGLESGNYTATTSKDGYAETSFNIVVLPGTVKGGQNATISPVTEGDYRVVLRWGSTPSDLDSHMTGYTISGSYEHIYYSHKTGYTANLDRDDTSSYGPETVTVTDFDSLENGFTYSVHDFSNKSNSNSYALSSSGAIVELYSGDMLIKRYYVPRDRVGTVWRVFSIDADGNVTDINYFYNQSSASSVN